MTEFDDDIHIHARLRVKDLLEEWTGIHDMSYQSLKELIGEPDAPSMRHISSKAQDIVFALAGPNGYTVYKMLLARKDK